MTATRGQTGARNIRFDLEYDGRGFHGFQWQPDRPTVEGAAKQALETLLQHEVTVYSCGRTDAGVHALQHTAHVFTDNAIPLRNFLRGLNSLLPPGVSAWHAMDMPAGWSARHDPIEREYRYTILNSPFRSALLAPFVLWSRDRLDAGAMAEAARHLAGEHDFSAFRSLHCDADHPVRRLDEATVVHKPPLITLRVRGTAFLRHQVRIMAGTLYEAGRGFIEPAAVRTILESRDRGNAGPTLAAHGLMLTAVRYREDPPDMEERRSMLDLFPF